MTGRRPTSPSSKSFPPPPTTQSSQSHAPLQPSGLREAHTLVTSPDEIEQDEFTNTRESQGSSAHPSPNSRPTQGEHGEPENESLVERLHLGELPSRAINETTSLLRKPFEFMKPHVHDGPCDHGTFSPRLQSRPQSVRSGISGYGFGLPARPSGVDSGDGAAERSLLGGLFSKGSPRGSTRSPKKKMSTTNYLAELHGIPNTTTM